jgi:hypothetical protein
MTDTFGEDDEVVGQLPQQANAPAVAPMTTATPPVSTFGAGDEVVAPPDPYRQAAVAEYEANPALPGRSGGGWPGVLKNYTERALHGTSLGYSDEIGAAINTPMEMIRHGVGPSEGYSYAKALENYVREKTLENTPGGFAAEIAGGLVGTGPRGALTGTMPAVAPVARTIPQRIAGYGLNIGKGAGVGAVAGFGEGDSLEDRARNSLIGGAFGGALGAALPPTFWAAQKGYQAAFGRLRNADTVATEQIGQVARDAGMTPQEIVQSVTDANAAGQPYTVADALGKEGQRKLTALAKTPGAQRDVITETLNARNLNMPYRVGNQVGDALGAPGTAQAASDALIDQAATASAPLYRQAEQVPTWNERLQAFLNDPIARQGLRHGVEIQRLRSVGGPEPFNPTDAMITGFNEAGDPIITGVPNMRTLHTLKVGLDHMVGTEQNPITGRLSQYGNAINGFKNRLLSEIDAENPTYAAARTAYGGPMRVNDAVRVGQEMPTNGRYEDTIRGFNALPPTDQQGVRIGYADTVRGQLERTGNFPGILREKSAKGANELDALSLFQGPDRPGAPSQLRQRLNREEDMIKTSNAALGGATTAENLADMANTPGVAGPALGLVSNLAHGNVGGTARNLFEILGRAAKGESEAQRNAITRALLETNPNQVQAMADRIAQLGAARAGRPLIMPRRAIAGAFTAEGQ